MMYDVETLVGQRVFGIAPGYEDLLDQDELCHDPVLGAVPGRLEARRRDCAPLAEAIGCPQAARHSGLPGPALLSKKEPRPRHPVIPDGRSDHIVRCSNSEKT